MGLISIVRVAGITIKSKSSLGIAPSNVYAALAYYHANRDEIEADLAEEDAEYWKLALLHGKKA